MSEQIEHPKEFQTFLLYVRYASLPVENNISEAIRNLMRYDAEKDDVYRCGASTSSGELLLKAFGSLFNHYFMYIEGAKNTDFLKPLELGAKKYGANSWLGGNHFNRKDSRASIYRHLTHAYNDIHELDEESGVHHILHAMCRIVMEYTLDKRGVKID